MTQRDLASVTERMKLSFVYMGKGLGGANMRKEDRDSTLKMLSLRCLSLYSIINLKVLSCFVATMTSAKHIIVFLMCVERVPY